MSEALYLPDDDSRTEFTNTVTEATTDYIILEGTYFYAEGGGQPGDQGTITWKDGSATIRDTRKNHGDIRHIVKTMEGEPPAPGTEVTGEIDKERREKLSRMHTAQHVVSRVVLDQYEAATAGNQIHVERSRIDFELASFDNDDLEFIQRKSNEAIERDHQVTKENRPRDRVEETVDEGRSMLDMIPDSVDPLRVVEVSEFDMCPCGGTHVDSLGEIGRINIIGRTSKGKNVDRIEFTLETEDMFL